jgi:hypothetical protein
VVTEGVLLLMLMLSLAAHWQLALQSLKLS